MTIETFYRRVIEETGQPDRERAKRATAAVLHALRDRLTFEEAGQVAAQLPRPLKMMWWEGEVAGRRPMKMHRREFYERVKGEAGLASIREARWNTVAVFGALKEQLSPGEAEDVLAQLPKDLKDVWEEA
jgi:uncharacterized protein (DUF2267 family)